MRSSSEAPSWWSRHGRWVVTVGSGLALAVGMAFSWLGPSLGLGTDAAPIAWHGWAMRSPWSIGGIGIFPRAMRNLARLRFDIDVLMGLAILGAMALGQWDEAATVAFLYGLSESLEAMSLDYARRSIRALLELAPPTAERIASDGTTEKVPASQVRRGDRVLIRSGDTIPVDGTVALGRSSVDQKTITGESVPGLREEGDPVYAGTINGDGTLEVTASGPVGDALDLAGHRPGPREPGRACADRAADFAVRRRLYADRHQLVAPGHAGSAALGPGDWRAGAADAGVWREWFGRGLVVLVIACPCALVIATPVAVVCGLAAAARGGVLIRGGEYLEEIGRLRAIAFDKTGTLTRGQPDVVEVVCAPGQEDESRVLRIAAALGDRGGHVLGKAIARHARGLRLDVPVADNYTAIPGLGALGQVDAVEYHLGSHRYIDEAGMCRPEFHTQLGQAEKTAGTAVALTASSGPLGWIRLADRPRPEAARVLAELHQLGLQTIMLTGDNATDGRRHGPRAGRR